jgi:hypothetical protein
MLDSLNNVHLYLHRLWKNLDLHERIFKHLILYWKCNGSDFNACILVTLSTWINGSKAAQAEIKPELIF